MAERTFSDFGISVPAKGGRNRKTLCPECSHTRKNKSDPCLSVNVEEGTWFCHNCNWRGGLGRNSDARPRERQKEYRRPPPLLAELPKLTLEALRFFEERGISEEVVSAFKVQSGAVWFPQTQDEQPAISIPYLRPGGELVNFKHRGLKQKHFRMEKDAELCLFNLANVRRAREENAPLIWVEGELDVMALAMAGFVATSVPSGANKEENNLGQFLQNESDAELIGDFPVHVLAGDADEPGRALSKEIARRMDPDRCRRVRWPEDCKDANDVLLKHGVDTLAECIHEARPLPVADVTEPSFVLDQALSIKRGGVEDVGEDLGWYGVKQLYRPARGYMTVVTGTPGSGKSNFVDAIAVNLARNQGWSFAIFSPENEPLEHHIASLCEKVVDKPARPGPTERMTDDEMISAVEWMDEHFHFLTSPTNPEDDWTIDKILDRADVLVRRFGIDGLVIDPWNELESTRPKDMTETDFIGQVLKRLRNFARARNIHIWIVAHPSKIHRNAKGEFPPLTLYNISGSANWINKADFGIVVVRNFDEPHTPVEIQIQKMRFRRFGKLGQAKLDYDPKTATYRDHAIW